MILKNLRVIQKMEEIVIEKDMISYKCCWNCNNVRSFFAENRNRNTVLVCKIIMKFVKCNSICDLFQLKMLNSFI